MKISGKFALFCVALGQMGSAFAQQQAEPNIATGRRQIIEEVIHEFEVEKLKPRVDLSKAASSKEPASPDELMAAWVGAMKSGNFDAYSNLFDPVSRQAFLGNMQRLHRGPREMAVEWQSLLKGRVAYFTYRIRYGDYVLCSAEFWQGAAHTTVTIRPCPGPASEAIAAS